MEIKEKLNFNELAWRSPKHEAEGDSENLGFGYLPTDNHYQKIIEWLRSCAEHGVVWQFRSGNVTVKRMHIPESQYDVVVRFNHVTKMIDWVFRAPGCYEV